MRHPEKAVVVVGLIFVALGATAAAQPRWQVDGASVVFEIKNAGFAVRGSFSGLAADLRFDPDHPENSVILASIDSATVDAGIELRNRHLRKRDYFDVAQYPHIRMRALRVEKLGPGAFTGTFALDLKETRREITMPFTFSRHAGSATLTGEFILDRLDYGIGERSVILADEVIVRVSVEISPAE